MINIEMLLEKFQLIKQVSYFTAGTLLMTRKAKGRIYTPTLTRLHIQPGYRLYVTLAIWSELCNVPFEEIVEYRSFEVVELFFQYIRRLDDWLDTPSGMRSFVENPNGAKTRPELSEITRELVTWICQANVARSTKRELLALIRLFRTRAIWNAWYPSMKRQLEGKQTVRELMVVVEETSGLMYWVFCALLSRIHGVPSVFAQRAQQAFCFWMVALQFADDLYDFQDDFREETQSIVSTVLMCHPLESKKLEMYLEHGGELDNTWIRLNAPDTYAEISSLYQSYYEKMLAVDKANNVVRWMGIGAESAFHMSTASPFIPKFMLAFIHIQARFRTWFYG